VPIALITGTSTGIGRATALRLASAGWTVLAGVREEAAGERLLADSQRDGGERPCAEGSAAGPGGGSVVPVILDVTDSGQIADGLALVRSRAGDAAHPSRGGLDALVNNAGIAVGGPLELLSLTEVQRLLEVNLLGQIAVTQAMLPALRTAGGRIVFVSSIGGLVAVPYNAPYAASKHAVEAVGDSLRLELRSSGVQVALVEPGSIATPIWEKTQRKTEQLEVPPELESHYGAVPATMAKVLADTQRRGIAPDVVARTIERALLARRMRPRYMVGRDARGMLLTRRLLPDRLFDRVVARTLGL
jgi:NAD(P)-dependent dehydrogenase (short-subunit alcohol dehydrogenase family)